jgi:hypothetical protein
MILESIHSFARNKTETINKFLCANKQANGTDEPNYRNIYLLLYELQIE